MVMSKVTTRNGTSVSGHLLADAVNRKGLTQLENLYHSVPFHISKPYWDGSVLLLQVASPTAGLFSGDQLFSKVTVEEGAALMFTNQGASRIHPRTEDGVLLEQEFKVCRNGWLEIFPELIIPHKGANLTQKTIVTVARGGRAYLAEMLTPGRTAFGETYAYEKLDLRFTLTHGNRPLVIERAKITAKTIPWMFARPPQWEQIYYGCAWAIAPELSEMQDRDFKELEDLSTHDRLVGSSRISPNAIAIKVISSSSIPLRDALQRVRIHMSTLLPFLNTNPRKL